MVDSIDQQEEYVRKEILAWLRADPESIMAHISGMSGGDCVPYCVDVAGVYWQLDLDASSNAQGGTAVYRK